jgi:hypothetical protein
LKNISVEIMGEHALVNGIPSVIEEMIYNLYDNAIKYNKENGKIKVTVSDENGIPQSRWPTRHRHPERRTVEGLRALLQGRQKPFKKIGGTGIRPPPSSSTARSITTRISELKAPKVRGRPLRSCSEPAPTCRALSLIKKGNGLPFPFSIYK